MKQTSNSLNVVDAAHNIHATIATEDTSYLANQYCSVQILALDRTTEDFSLLVTYVVPSSTMKVANRKDIFRSVPV